MWTFYPLRKRRAKGLTLVETALGLAISAVVVATAHAAMRESFRKNEITENANLIVDIVSAARTSFGQRGLFNEISTALAMKSGVIPPQNVNGNLAFNSYGGAIDLQPLSVKNDFAYMRFDDVPEDQCMAVVMAVNDAFQRICVTSGPADNKPVDTDPCWAAKSQSTNYVLDIALLKAKCTPQTQGDPLKLHFVFGR